MSKPIPGLKKIREEKLLTQAELEKLTGVDQSIISKAESGKKISFGSIKKIATGLRIKPEKLMAQ